MINDHTLGIYRKYSVHRENDPEGKHDECHFFVLDSDHDKYAAAALFAYADACKEELPRLADDLWALATEMEERFNAAGDTA